MMLWEKARGEGRLVLRDAEIRFRYVRLGSEFRDGNNFRRAMGGFFEECGLTGGICNHGAVGAIIGMSGDVRKSITSLRERISGLPPILPRTWRFAVNSSLYFGNSAAAALKTMP
jgi:hypothetical protein